MTTGPKSSSVETPTSVSTPPVTISQTITPSMRARAGRPSGLARAARRTRRAPRPRSRRPTFTRPTSLLCSRSGDDTFITTGKPISLAALHRLGRRRAQHVLRRLDAVRADQPAWSPTPTALRRAAARRGSCGPCVAAGSGCDRRVVERRRVARRRTSSSRRSSSPRRRSCGTCGTPAARRRADACSTCRRCRPARPTPRRSACRSSCAASMMSRVNGSLNDRDRARDRDDHDVDVLVGEDRRRGSCGRPASATGGPPQSTGFETRRYAGIRPSCSLPLRVLGEVGDPQARVGEHVGHVRAGAARDRVHAHAGSLLSRSPMRAAWPAACARTPSRLRAARRDRRRASRRTGGTPPRSPRRSRSGGRCATAPSTGRRRSCRPSPSRSACCSLAAWSAASISVRPSLKPSM